MGAGASAPAESVQPLLEEVTEHELYDLDSRADSISGFLLSAGPCAACTDLESATLLQLQARRLRISRSHRLTHVTATGAGC